MMSKNRVHDVAEHFLLHDVMDCFGEGHASRQEDGVPGSPRYIIESAFLSSEKTLTLPIGGSSMKIVLIAALLLGAYFLYAKSTQAGGNSIAVTELKAGLDSGENMLVLDVRTLEEWNEGHINGAKHIPVDDLKQRIGELEKFRNTKIAVICLSGGRSAKASRFLSENGFSKIFNVSGGMSDWYSRNYPTAR